MSAMDISSLKFWESLADWGAWLVIIGVAGEGLEIVLKILQHKLENKRFLAWYDRHEFSIEVWGAVFWFMVVIGLAIEFRGGHKAKTITDRENTRLTQKSSELDLKAETFRLKADQLEHDMAETKKNVDNIDPLNEPVSDVSAVVTIKLAGTNFVESPLWGSSVISTLWIDADQDSMMKETKMNFQLPVLMAKKEDVTLVDYSVLLMPRQEAHGYVLHFREENGLVPYIPVLKNTPYKTRMIANYAKSLRIDAKFIPHDADFLGGNAEILINGKVRIDFDIFPQKAFPPPWGLGTNVGNSGFTFLATNATLRTIPEWMKFAPKSSK